MEDRIAHINDLMERLHNSSNAIYECLMDDDHEGLVKEKENHAVIMAEITL